MVVIFLEDLVQKERSNKTSQGLESTRHRGLAMRLLGAFNKSKLQTVVQTPEWPESLNGRMGKCYKLTKLSARCVSGKVPGTGHLDRSCRVQDAN
jgi:hypothetical protein